LAGLIGNRTAKRDLIDKYVQSCPMPVLEVLPLIEDIRVSRVKGKTLFEMAEKEPSLKYVCDYYLNIADQLLAGPEGVVPNEVPDRELFSLLSDFYLTPGEASAAGAGTSAEEAWTRSPSCERGWGLTCAWLVPCLPQRAHTHEAPSANLTCLYQDQPPRFHV